MTIDRHPSSETQPCRMPSASGPVRHHTRRRPFRGAWVTLRTLVVAGAFLAVGMQAPALAGYVPSGCGLTVSATSVAAGAGVTVSGCGFAGGSTVTITVESQVLGTVTADSTGAFSTTVTIPASLAPGVHTLEATGTAPDGSPLVLSASLTVVAASTPGLRISTAFTGSNIWPAVLIGGGLLLVGAVLVMTVRRRRLAT
jgi:hypothetical protein